MREKLEKGIRNEKWEIKKIVKRQKLKIKKFDKQLLIIWKSNNKKNW